MAGIIRSIINLTRWRGSEPNVLQSGRVDAHVGSVADGLKGGFTVQRGIGTARGNPNVDGNVTNFTITSVDINKAAIFISSETRVRAWIRSSTQFSVRVPNRDDINFAWQVIESE